MERHICFPQNVHESTLALQTVSHNAGVIHPIMDSEWVAPILLVPKKIGITLEEIKKDAYENVRFFFLKKRLRVSMTE